MGKSHPLKGTTILLSEHTSRVDLLSAASIKLVLRNGNVCERNNVGLLHPFSSCPHDLSCQFVPASHRKLAVKSGLHHAQSLTKGSEKRF